MDADTAFGKLGSRVDPKAIGSYWELAGDQHLETFADVRSRVGNNSAGSVRPCRRGQPRPQARARPRHLPRGRGPTGPLLLHHHRRLQFDDGHARHPGGAAGPRRVGGRLLAMGRRRGGRRADDGLAGQPRTDESAAAVRWSCSTTQMVTPTSELAPFWRSSSPARARWSSRFRSIRIFVRAASSRVPPRCPLRPGASSSRSRPLSPSTSRPTTSAAGTGTDANRVQRQSSWLISASMAATADAGTGCSDSARCDDVLRDAGSLCGLGDRQVRVPASGIQPLTEGGVRRRRTQHRQLVDPPADRAERPDQRGRDLADAGRARGDGFELAQIGEDRRDPRGEVRSRRRPVARRWSSRGC